VLRYRHGPPCLAFHIKVLKQFLVIYYRPYHSH
jgi:hypothetical protein